MTCNGCVAKVKSELLKMGDITEANVQLAAPQATITMQQHISTAALQGTIAKAGNYKISDLPSAPEKPAIVEPDSFLETYKPILLIFAYIIGITGIIEFTRGGFIWENWMTNFMAGFFLVFSFFKLLNIKGFAESYAMYDIVAKKWNGWGYVYALVELALGIAFLTKFNLLLTNMATFIIMGISIIGVIQSVLNKRKIQCACLGAVFNLPMSTVTIIEDGVMIVMSAVMIWMLV